MERKIKFCNEWKLLYTGNFMKDDPLIPLLNTVNFNFKHRIGYLTALSVFVVLFLQTFNAIGVIFIWQDKTRKKLVQYISVILCQQFGIVCNVLLLYYSRTISNLPNLVKQYFLPLNASSEGPYRRILRQCATIRKLHAFVILVPLITYFVFLPLVRDQEDIEFTAMFISKHTGAWSNFFLMLYYLCLISLGYSVACVCCVCMYVTLHLKFQLILLTEYLNQISSGCNRNINDVFCQDVIHRRLKSFVQAHTKFKEVSVMFLEVGELSVIMLVATAALAYTALIYFIASNVSPPSNFRFSIILLGAIFLNYLFITEGQDLQDKSADLYTAACRCEWISWNVHNRKSYLMIIMNCSKVLKMTSFGILDLGHQVLLMVMRISYSMVLLLANLDK